MKIMFSIQKVVALAILFVIMSQIEFFYNNVSAQNVPVGTIQKVQPNRNLALNRAAYHSSCINFNNTAHLVTDGGFTTRGRSAYSDQYNDSPENNTLDKLFDGFIFTKYLSNRNSGWVQYDFQDDLAYVINNYSLISGIDTLGRDPKDWVFQGSNDGTRWVTLDSVSDFKFQRLRELKKIKFENTNAYQMYRIKVTATKDGGKLHLTEFNIYEGTISRIGPDKLLSEWTSKTAGKQWIYVDLGANSTVNEVKLHWNKAYAKAYTIDVSIDKTNWQTVYSTSTGDGGTDVIPLTAISTRYVRLNTLSSADTSGYSLIEFEIYGTGGTIPEPAKQPAQLEDGRQYLTGGNWKLQRAESIKQSVKEISQPNFNDSSWIVATVPGTILVSYLNNGAIPDPNFGDQQLQISDAFFTADFWYRNTFTIPKNYKGKKVWINFDGINWKADIYVNGNFLGKINGAFIRGKFDITPYVTPDKVASLSVFIYRNDNPGKVSLQSSKLADPNGGELGFDNPTIHAAIGWDWIPTIRGRNIGIQDDVFLSTSSDISIVDPFITTDLPLPDTTSAALTIKVGLKNHSNMQAIGKLTGVITPGNISFSKEITLSSMETKEITFDDKTFSQLLIKNPQLWWPNGYGEQKMNNLALTLTMDGKISDSKNIPFGIREITHDTENSMLTIKVNGIRIFCRGGNWGMSESMLRLDKEGYDIRVRLHKEANFTMIRNWVGMTGDENFYHACDKYGILIWDDFWLANPVDGPDPNDVNMFMANVEDKIKRFRNHPSIALYCARNEGNPPASLATKLPEATTKFDGTRPYIPHSASDVVTGYGPYSIKDPVYYFQNRVGKKLHSEMGMPNVPSVESVKAMIPKEHLWPINDVWGIHDFCINAAMNSWLYITSLNQSYGEATDVYDFCIKAQMVNMENHKAMFEPYAGAQSNGLLMWMSMSAWPSMVWQTFDYYLEQTAGYYGCKKACEPLHIMWDSKENVIKVTNNTGKAYAKLNAIAQIYNLDGTLAYGDSVTVDAGIDTVITCFNLKFPENLSETHFIKLKLKSGNKVLTDNFYWRGTKYQDYNALSTLKSVNLKGSAKQSNVGNTRFYKVNITNPTANVALMIRLKVLKNISNDRVLPTYYSDNYFSLLPYESKEVTLEFDSKYLDGEKPKIMIEGWNINPFEVVDVSK